MRARQNSNNSYVYSVAINPSEPADAYRFTDSYIQEGQRLYMGFGFEKNEIKKYIGSRITHINITSGCTESNGNPVEEVTIFITKGLGRQPFITKKAILKESAYTVNSIKLDTPYEITDDTPLYIGYYFTYRNNPGWYTPVDNVYTNSPGNLYAICDGDGWPGEDEWENRSDRIGSLCMSVTLQGEKFPENIAAMLDMSVPSSLKAGDELTYEIDFVNKGANQINDLEIRTTIDGSVYTSKIKLPDGVAPGSRIQTNVSGINVNKSGIFDIVSEIVKVNGMANTIPNNGISTIIIYYTNGYQRNIVLEEGTGTWCGYCPRGIVMCEYIREKYADRLFPIAVHSGDLMEIPEYNGFLYDFISSYPTVVANRKEIFTPSTYMADEFYRKAIETPAYARINFTCKVTDKTLSISAETEFSLSTNVEHQLSFVVIEDGVGPYLQSNYFGPDSGMGKWDNAGSDVVTLFDDVARHIDSYPGIPNSLPSAIKEDTKYSFNRTIDISRVTSDQFRVVGMITNTHSGEIINASQMVVAPDGGIILDKKSLLLNPNETAQLKASIYGGNNEGKTITWSSSDEKIATVDNNGLVTAIGIGKAVITASCNGRSSTCNVEVTAINATFESDGINYRVTGNLTCEVSTLNDGGQYTQEHIIIPAEVHYYDTSLSVTAIGFGSFSAENCPNIKSIQLPNTITKLDGWALNGSRHLESIELPNSLTTIGMCAFQSSGLRKIEIPESVTYIMDGAFNFCENLTEVTITGSPTIDRTAYNKAPLEKIICKSPTPPSLAQDVFDVSSDIYNTCTLFVPEESIDTYKASPEWGKFANIKAIDSNDGIDMIMEDESTCDVFSTTGICVAQRRTVSGLRDELPSGIYILRFANGKTGKIAIR